MSIEEVLRNDFAVGKILEIHDMSKSNNCYLIVTDKTSYVFKQVDRLDFIKIYDKVQNVLNEKGFIQGRPISTKNHGLMSLNGYSLFEYIPGDALEKYNDEQFFSIIKLLNKYNEMLREVPFLAEELEDVNNWDKIKSVAFMCHKVEEILNQCEMDNRTQLLLRNAKKMLLDQSNYFNGNRKQLIHSDLGPGNIVFEDNKIRTIIDFTPEYENELYALSQFIYWTCLLDFQESYSINRISSALKVYYNHDVKQELYEGLFPYLLKACMFRIMGPLLNMIESGVLNMSNLQNRIKALETLFDIRREIT